MNGFHFLQCAICVNETSEADLIQRLKKTEQTWNAKQHIEVSTACSKNKTKHIYNSSNVKSVLLYACKI